MQKNNELILMQPDLDTGKIPTYKQTIPINIYHFYIVEEITDPDKYLDLINTLKTAEAHDTIFIYLNTPGGALHTTVQIISAMRQCAGTVVTCLEGEVYSAGTIIFLCGHKHVVNPNCTFMIHDYSSVEGGKGNEMALRIKYAQDYFKRLAHDVYGGFLSEDELQSVLAGKDMWLGSEEVIERLNALTEAEAEDEAESEAGLTVASVTEGVVQDIVDQTIRAEARKKSRAK